MKFSVKSNYPISTSLRAIDCRASRELVAAGVEYFFMGDGSQKHGQIAEGNNDFRYLGISGLNAKPQLDIGSGRYRLKNTVPI
ncbi:hypothetical protein [Calothrix sp. PCC 7507]|uniref:hypothetical protein n=1 Tax=Calothrix sp. PCC 7507 TaxID=99598 RepID=UPI00029F2D4F|nr:hypothetical protein [Calothrix sp. PCC 7507]AFY34734.1 hypothetical protein Cal7507_4363 [Calothrix sp. PCC 7507]